MPVFLSALDLAQVATPATNPPSGRNLVYVKADGKVYTKNSAGTEALVGAVSDPLIVTELRTTKIDSNPPGTADVTMGTSLNANGHTFYGIPTPTNNDWAANKAYVDSVAAATPGAAVQIGAIAMWPTATPPANYLICDGSVLFTDDYQILSGILRPTYGGPDATHFYLPDLRSRVPMGAGSIGNPGGSEGQTTESLRPPRHDGRHTHTVADHSHAVGTLGTGGTGSAHTHTIDVNAVNTAPTTGASPKVTAVGGQGGGTSGTGVTSGGGTAHSHNVTGSPADGGAGSTSSASTAAGPVAYHPFLAVNFIIRAL
jgi:microcystin-dependent protein